MTAEPTNRDNARPDGDEDHIEPIIGAEDADADADGESGLTPHDERLFALASRIDQGHAIDWDAAERDATDDHERAIIAEMRLLADVARVGREHATPADALAADLAAAGAGDRDLQKARGEQNEPGGNQGEGEHGDPDGRGRPRGRGDQHDRTEQGYRDEPFDYELPPPPTRWGSLTIHEPIGRGAFATVYRAQDNLGRLVALKLFPLPDELAIDWAARLLHEGRLLARLRHENVVTIHGADQGDDYVGLWMEFVKGRTLEEELHTRVRFSADEAVHVGRMLCRALAAVHGEGLLHRDVKAHNVMRDETGRIVLMDFGSGRELALEDARIGADLVGTPLYLAPEVFAGQPASIASDIYSLGVLLFHLVSDRYPVQGGNRAEIQEAHADRRRLFLRDARPDLPDAFVRVVERAIAADRTQRFQSAGEFEDALAGTGMLPSSASSGGSSAPVIDKPMMIGDPQPSTQKPDAEKQSQAAASPSSRPRRRWQAIAAGASLLVAAAMLVVVLPRVVQRQAAGPSGTTNGPAISQGPSAATTATPGTTGKTGAGGTIETAGKPPSPTSAAPTPEAGTGPPGANGAGRNPSGASASDATPASYVVQASFFTQDPKDGRETTLASGDRVAPGSLLGLRVQTSKPAYVYVANQDEHEQAFVLYPLGNVVPLTANREHRLPEDDTGDLWEVSSPGGREHFVVFVSLTPLQDFDQILRSVPRAAAGRPVSQVPIPKNLIGQTRGVGGLARARRSPSKGLERLFDQAKPLLEQRETAEGEWVRMLMLVNPVTRRQSPSSSLMSPLASPSTSAPSR